MRHDRKILRAVLVLTLGALTGQAGVILFENFEDQVLDPRITTSTTGAFSTAPGIYSWAALSGEYGYFFGRSTCGATCWSWYMSSLIIDLGSPTYVTDISFKEMELGSNWGSQGFVIIDGVPVTADPRLGQWGQPDFGRLPVNDWGVDQTFRTQVFPVNATIQRIELLSWDITDRSGIALDDLTINGADLGPGAVVPEPSTWLMVLCGVAILAGARRALSRPNA